LFKDKVKLSNQEWEILLRKLSAGEIPASEIGSAIVRLSKPFDSQRVAAAKDTVLLHLSHRNGLARQEAMWFIRWAGFREEKSALIRALRNDTDPDNRGYAALCTASLMAGTADKESVDALKAAVLDENEDASVRTDAYGALLEVATNRRDSDFNMRKKSLDDVDWEWISKLR
jgi:hypothetical protein